MSDNSIDDVEKEIDRNFKDLEKRAQKMRTMTIEDIGELLAEKDARIKELEEALRFYADHEVWSVTGEQHCPSMTYGEDIEYCENLEGFTDGKIARAAIKDQVIGFS